MRDDNRGGLRMFANQHLGQFRGVDVVQEAERRPTCSPRCGAADPAATRAGPACSFSTSDGSSSTAGSSGSRDVRMVSHEVAHDLLLFLRIDVTQLHDGVAHAGSFFGRHFVEQRIGAVRVQAGDQDGGFAEGVAGHAASPIQLRSTLAAASGSSRTMAVSSSRRDAPVDDVRRFRMIGSGSGGCFHRFFRAAWSAG